MGDWEPPAPRRRRLWPVLASFGLVLALAVAWTGLWFYVASTAKSAIADWRVREGRAGRVNECGTESIGGFPFRIEVDCGSPRVVLRGAGKSVVLKAEHLLVAAQIYQPTLLIGEFTGPLTIAEGDEAPTYIATWTLGLSSVHGTRHRLERASLVWDDPVLRHAGTSGDLLMFKASHVELHGRTAEGSTAQHPALDFVIRAVAATAPEWRAAAGATDADITGTLHGLVDLRPKPWRVRFREMQARGGRIDIASARLKQGDVIVAGSGTIGLTARGGLQGRLDLTVVGLEQLLKILDVEQIVSRGKAASAFDSLDRFLPGLGKLARRNARPGIALGLSAIGKPAELEGKPAVTLPLTFEDGEIMLGPFKLGGVPPLF